jgi:hypothetical protein
LTWNVFGLV